MGRVKVKDPLSVPTRVGVIIIAEWRGAAPTSGLIGEQTYTNLNLKLPRKPVGKLNFNMMLTGRR